MSLFASMIRFLALGAVGLTMLAVGVSRLTPPTPNVRMEAPVTTVSINDHLLGVPDRQPRWLDVARGTVALTPLEGDDVLETASCSPWVDAQGHRQVIGRWSNRTFQGPHTVAHDFGIARFSFPDGQLLDQIPVENFPISPPCWLPGDRARVLFVAGDGRLRRLDFESGEAAVPVEQSTLPQPKPSLIEWDCPRPGGDEVFFGEVTWPRLPQARFGNMLVASMRYRRPDSQAGRVMSRSELWWLRLDRDCTKITALGPLLDHEAARLKSASGDERSPLVAQLPDGTLGLAFAQQESTTTAWSICLGRLEVLADGRPTCRGSSVRILDAREHLGPIAFSPDGRFLNYLIVEPNEAPVVSRYRTIPDAIVRNF